MSLEDATKASFKASAQLMFHTTHHIDKMIEERARLTHLEGEKSSMLKKLKDNDTKYQKDLKSKDSTINFLRKEVKDQEDMLKSRIPILRSQS